MRNRRIFSRQRRPTVRRHAGVGKQLGSALQKRQPNPPQAAEHPGLTTTMAFLPPGRGTAVDLADIGIEETLGSPGLVARLPVHRRVSRRLVGPGFEDSTYAALCPPLLTAR